MCFNKEVSLSTFFIGCLFSLLLIYKNPQNLEYKTTGIFFIFISFIQFIEFIFWIDINNKLGLNKIATIVGPILNLFQPNILYLIKIYFYKPNLLTFTHSLIALLNLFYFIFSFINYIKFLSLEDLTTNIEKRHLKWKWLKYSSNNILYLILLGINIYYLFSFKYATLLFLITYFFFYISYKYFNYHIGEIWCFFGSFIPLIIYLINMI